MLNIILINYPNYLTKYIKKDVWNDPNAKKGLLRGRHSFCLSYPTKGREQPQRSNISTVSQIPWNSTDGNHNQPTRPRDTKHWPPIANPLLPLPAPLLLHLISHCLFLLLPCPLFPLLHLLSMGACNEHIPFPTYNPKDAEHKVTHRHPAPTSSLISHPSSSTSCLIVPLLCDAPRDCSVR
jgi:hypothetical protein